MSKIMIVESSELLNVKEDGKIVQRYVPTRYEQDGIRYFAVDTVYAFPVNNMNDLEKNNGSVYVIRVTVPADTEEQAGYTAIREFIKQKLNMCPAATCLALRFYEVVGCDKGQLDAKTSH